MKKSLWPCLGIPVFYDPKLKNISDSRGLWRWKKIVVGPAFFRLDEREAGAVLLHEAGHVKLRHLEKRLTMLWLVLISPQKLLRICVEQEFEADRFAARCGYGADLTRLFHRLAREPQMFHPSLDERIARLTE